MDDKHPSASDIPPIWEVDDKLYILKEMNPTVRVLLDMSKTAWQRQ